jgi:HAD superfamily hydrolase (TIGR01509 family)
MADFEGAILFDLGNVLVHFSHDRMFHQVAQCLGASEQGVRRLLAVEGLLWEYERGKVSTEAVYERLRTLGRRPAREEELFRAASDIFTSNPPMERLALELLKRGYRVIVVSNTCPIHVAWLDQQFSFFRQLKERVLSYEVGAAKPELEIFLAAVQKAAVPPDLCFYVDDSPGHVQAARRLGIDGVVYESPRQVLVGLRRRGLPLEVA